MRHRYIDGNHLMLIYDIRYSSTASQGDVGLNFQDNPWGYVVPLQGGGGGMVVDQLLKKLTLKF